MKATLALTSLLASVLVSEKIPAPTSVIQYMKWYINPRPSLRRPGTHFSLFYDTEILVALVSPNITRKWGKKIVTNIQCVTKVLAPRLNFIVQLASSQPPLMVLKAEMQSQKTEPSNCCSSPLIQAEEDIQSGKFEAFLSGHSAWGCQDFCYTTVHTYIYVFPFFAWCSSSPR